VFHKYRPFPAVIQAPPVGALRDIDKQVIEHDSTQMHIKRIWTNHLMAVTPPGTRKLAGSANAVQDQEGRNIVSIIWFERSHTHVARAMSKGAVPNAMFQTAMLEDSEEPTTRYLPSGENAAEQRYRDSFRRH